MKGNTSMSNRMLVKPAVDEIYLNNNEKAVEDYKNGLDRSIKFLMGQIMKETKGKANPGMVNKILKELL